MKKITIGVLLCTIFPFVGLFAAETHWASTYSVDIDGDGIKEDFIYTLDKESHNYKGSLTIKSKDGRFFWTHEFEMTPDDLENDLLREEGNISVSHWVKHFFDGTLTYGATFEKIKIKKGDIDDRYIKFYAEREKVQTKKLKQEILSQKINTTFSYRSSWREDLIILVYVPSLRKFIAFSGGEYNH